MTARNSFPDELERRARRAIFWHALLRWESATIIALTLVISVLLGLLALVGRVPTWWALGALGFGLMMEALVFASSVTDDEENARVVANLLRSQYEPKRLRSQKLRKQLEKALEYQGLIASTVRRSREGVLRDRLLRATEPVGDWIEAIHRLAERLDSFEENEVIRHDLRAVPLAVENFKKRLSDEDDPVVKETLRNTIADKQRQWQQLDQLQNTMQRAEFQLESTLAALGTVYAQLQAIDLRGSDKGRTESLRQEIGEQVAQLQDLSNAMDEVYTAR